MPESDRITFAGSVTAEGRRLRGSVTLARSRTWRNNEWLEVDPAALVKADATDVVGRWEHDPMKILGRTTNGTLSLSRTDQGIVWETTDLPDTSYASDALALVRGGYVAGSSFEIEGLRSEFSTDPDGTRVRRITHIDRLTDVSPTAHPAFADSSAAAFHKESEMTDSTVDQPMIDTPAPADLPAPAPEAPRAKFTDQPVGNIEQFKAAARQLTTDQLAQVMDNIMSESKGDLGGEMLSRYEAFAAVYAERTAVTTEERDRSARMKALHDLRLGRIPKAPEVEAFASDEYREAFTSYLRTGDARDLEQFAQSVAGDGTQGGYSVPESFRQRIVERMVQFGGIQSVAETITTSDGRDLPWPSNDDTANSAAIASEGSAVASGGADLVFGEVRLGAYTYDATGTGNVPLLVSKELIQDSAFDIEAFVSRKLAERLGRKMAADFATADGAGKPKGLLAKSADVMTATSMFAALQEHFFQVDQAYRDSGNCRWVFGDNTLAKVYASVDLNGRPLFIPTSDASGAGRPAGILLGHPVTLDQGSGDKVAFRDIFLGFIIRYVRSVQVDVDPYTNIKSRQIAYHAWARADSDVQDAYAYSVSDYSGVSADATA